jgi:glycerol-3-phosphate acyltransferase PlsY
VGTTTDDRGFRNMSARARRLAAAAAAYAIGSFPTADLVSRYVARRRGDDRHIDLREAGTKNPGALNAARVLGTKWGLIILAGDVLKGALACIAGRRLGGDDGAYVAGIGAVAGHCFPATSRFRGGKGVATSAGTSLICFPAYMPADLALAGATVVLSKGQAGVATYVASGVFTVAAAFWHRRHLPNLWGPPPGRWLPIYAVVTSAMIAYKFLTAPPAPSDAESEPQPIDAPAHSVNGEHPLPAPASPAPQAHEEDAVAP